MPRKKTHGPAHAHDMKVAKYCTEVAEIEVHKGQSS